MTNKEAIEKLKEEFCKLKLFCELYPDECNKENCEIYLAISALEGKGANVSNVDAISRQAAIAVADSSDYVGLSVEDVKKVTDEVVKGLKQLPSAEPERKKGKWIYNSPVTMKCDQCGLVIKDWDWYRFKYCPNCIAEMRGEQE